MQEPKVFVIDQNREPKEIQKIVKKPAEKKEEKTNRLGAPLTHRPFGRLTGWKSNRS